MGSLTASSDQSNGVWLRKRRRSTSPSVLTFARAEQVAGEDASASEAETVACSPRRLAVERCQNREVLGPCVPLSHRVAPAHSHPAFNGVQESKQRTYRRFATHMRPTGKSSFTVPNSFWPGPATPPKLPCIAVEDAAEGVHYMMCSFCQCDRVYRRVEALMKHLASGECPEGRQEFLRLCADANIIAEGCPMLLESGQAPPESVMASLPVSISKCTSTAAGGHATHLAETAVVEPTPDLPPPPLPPSSPAVSRWRRAAGALLEAAAAEAAAAPLAYKPVACESLADPCSSEFVKEKLPIRTAAEVKIQMLKELSGLCPNWYQELNQGLPGLLGRTAQELTRLVAVARERPEVAASSNGCGGNGPAQLMPRCPPVAAAAAGTELIEQRVVPAPTLAELLAAVAASDAAPFGLAACRSEFLQRMDDAEKEDKESVLSLGAGRQGLAACRSEFLQRMDDAEKENKESVLSLGAGRQGPPVSGRSESDVVEID